MKKELREKVYNKYKGCCAYCGTELQKGWHVDELKPVQRNFDKNGKYDGTCLHPENFNINNQMPSCPSCNINKHSMPLEQFRIFIQNFIISLNRDSTQYKIAKRYGLITETKAPVLFYFEKVSCKKI